MTSIREPKQARSKATYERLLDAAQEVMAEKSFDAASIQEIADTAGVTAGAFYARFSDKEALLIGISERLQGLTADLLEGLEAFAATEPSFEDLVRRVIRDSADFYTRHRALLRPFRRTASAHPSLTDRTRAMNTGIRARLSAVLLADHGAITHPDPELAIEAAQTIIVSTLRMRLLEDDLFPDDTGLSREALVDELTTAVLAYLAAAPAATGGAR